MGGRKDRGGEKEAPVCRRWDRRTDGLGSGCDGRMKGTPAAGTEGLCVTEGRTADAPGAGTDGVACGTKGRV